MIGKSYDGTCANAVRFTSADGLETIVPLSALAVGMIIVEPYTNYIVNYANKESDEYLAKQRGVLIPRPNCLSKSVPLGH